MPSSCEFDIGWRGDKGILFCSMSERLPVVSVTMSESFVDIGAYEAFHESLKRAQRL
jgi:hypothetical protein